MTVDFKGCSAEVAATLNRVAAAVHGAVDHYVMDTQDVYTREAFTVFVGHTEFRAMRMVDRDDLYGLRNNDTTFMSQHVIRVMKDSYLAVVRNTNLKS